MLPLLEIKNLSINFVTENRTTQAVRDISLQVKRGEILALVGESGSGKSVTSLSLLKLLPQPPAVYAGGNLLFSANGTEAIDLLQLPDREMQKIRGNQIAMIFQEPMTSLNPVMRCGHQVMEALLQHKKLTAAEARRETLAWFAKVQLPDPPQLFDRYPHQLSGGQKQRVMIAMALCCQPALLICDEPTTALDVTVQKAILQLIRELQQELQMGVIFITHDLGVVKEIADRVAILYRGEIVEINEADALFRSPSHPYTRALIACRPALHPKGERLPVVSDFTDPQTSIRNDTRAATASVQEQEVLMEVKDLTVCFPVRTNIWGKPTAWFTAVDGVSLTINKGEIVGLVGESGCGKTTLGRTLLHLIPPSSGTILYEGKNITDLSTKASRALRKEVQLVFQDPYSSLNPRLTIGAALEEPLKTGYVIPKDERRKTVRELLEKVSLPASMLNRYPHEFSGGQRQRIVIARALALNPAFVVCDESVSALDVSVQAQVLNLLNDLKKDLGLTLLFISHDLSVVRYMSDRILVMNKGTIVESGLADEVYYQPKNSYTQRLVAAIPTL